MFGIATIVGAGLVQIFGDVLPAQHNDVRRVCVMCDRVKEKGGGYEITLASSTHLASFSRLWRRQLDIVPVWGNLAITFGAAAYAFEGIGLVIPCQTGEQRWRHLGRACVDRLAFR